MIGVLALGIYTALFSVGNALGAALGGAAAQAWALNGIILCSGAGLIHALLALQLVPQAASARTSPP